MKRFKLIFFTVLQILMTTTLVGAFFGLPYALTICKTQPGLSVTFGIVIILSFVFGRYFCQALCPLGAIQDLVALVFHPRTKVRRVCSRLPRSKAQQVVSGLIMALAFLGAAWGTLAFFDPCGILGRFVSLCVGGGGSVGFVVLAVGMFALVVVTAAFGHGRFWCNWICPMGTVFDLVARFACFKDKVGPHCVHCRKCFAAGVKSDSDKLGSACRAGLTRRETLQGFAALAVTEKLTDGGYASISQASSPLRETPVLPPGALWGEQRFAITCVGCQLCVAHCPSKCLKPISWSGQVGLDFRDGYCLQDCTKCAEVCPMGAMQKLTVAEKRNVHIGLAAWKKDLCIRTKGETCRACERKCPVNAIRWVGDAMVVDSVACVGCGACEHVCPSRPEPAIVVEGLFRQRAVRPMGEEDLLAEMLGLLSEGSTLVIARDGVIRERASGHGVKDTLRLLDEGKLKKAIVADKVVGRAAASIFIVGKVKRVWAQVMSEDALSLLKQHNVEAASKTLVPKILNADRTDRCPLEKASDNASDPKKIIVSLRKFIQ